MTYSMEAALAGDYDSVKADVIAALKEQGFGILSEIDVQMALKEKIGQEIERYEILGACNPHLAHQALAVDRTIGVLLPCNVVLREANGGVMVSIADPEAMFTVVSDEVQRDLSALPAEAKLRLGRALRALTEADGSSAG